MGIMDVLAELSGPEYDEPAQAPEADREAPAAAPEAAAEPSPVPAVQAPTPAEIPAEPPAIPVTEGLDVTYPPVEQMLAVLRKKPRFRVELVMGIVAAFAAALLIALVALCFPFFTDDEDPEALPQYHEQLPAFQVTERPEAEFLEPTIPETEPENPTIPPDTNPYDRNDFQYNRQNYLLLQDMVSYPGVDVSAYQGVIDWDRVKASGIDFAIIRLGYRGYESGKLVEDKYAVDNLEGARDAGLRVGAYFFSQALNKKEVDQEIKFMLEILGERYLDMPIVLDWEIPASSARTRNMDAETLTEIQLHFCQTMEEKGYQPMIYFNWHQSEKLYYLSELEDYPFWLALYQDRMTYPWKIEMWQYSQTGRVPGINGDVDLNVYMPE